MKKGFVLLLAASLALSISCSNKDDKMGQDQNQTQNQTQQQTQQQGSSNPHDLMQLADDTNADNLNDPNIHFANFTMAVPADWAKERPESSMRVSQFFVKKSPDVKIGGFYFGDLNKVKENVDRWRGEFTKEEKFNETKLLGDKIVMVEIYGTYKLKPFPMAQEFKETPNYATLAAIVPSSEGPYYFKMVGPANVVKTQVENFKKFLNSYK